MPSSRYATVVAVFAASCAVGAPPVAQAYETCADYAVCAWTGYFEGAKVEFGPIRQGICTRVSFSTTDIRFTIQNNSRWPAYVHETINCTDVGSLVPAGTGLATANGFRSVKV